MGAGTAGAGAPSILPTGHRPELLLLLALFFLQVPTRCPGMHLGAAGDWPTPGTCPQLQAGIWCCCWHPCHGPMRPCGMQSQCGWRQLAAAAMWPSATPRGRRQAGLLLQAGGALAGRQAAIPCGCPPLREHGEAVEGCWVSGFQGTAPARYDGSRAGTLTDWVRQAR